VKHVLYVADNPADAERANLKQALLEVGAEVDLHVVANGVKAFDYLAGRGGQRSAPDLILLDLNGWSPGRLRRLR